jgi:hypothetical protein
MMTLRLRPSTPFRNSARACTTSRPILTHACYPTSLLAVLMGEASMERGHMFERENLSDISGIKLS